MGRNGKSRTRKMQKKKRGFVFEELESMFSERGLSQVLLWTHFVNIGATVSPKYADCGDPLLRIMAALLKKKTEMEVDLALKRYEISSCVTSGPFVFNLLRFFCC